MIEFEVYALGAIGVILSLVYWILLAVLAVGVTLILSSQKTQRAQIIAKLMLVEWILPFWCVLLMDTAIVLEKQINGLISTLRES